MVIFNDNTHHLLSIKEMFYKYIFEPDLENFDLFKRKNLESYEGADFIQSQLNKIKFCIRICDFQELHNIFETVSNEIKYNSTYVEKFYGVNLELHIIFGYFASMCLAYHDIINRENFQEIDKVDILRNIQNLETDCRAVLVTINEVMDKLHFAAPIRNNINEIIDDINIFLNVFSGDVYSIEKVKFINFFNYLIIQISENYKEIILMHIYYRFYHHDFYKTLGLSLSEDIPFGQKVDMHIISIIKYHPFEFYQKMKGEIPKWLQFHFLDILFDKEILSSEPDESLDGMTLRNYDYVDFLNYLVILDVEYKDFVNYAALFDSSENSYSFLMYMEKIVVKNVIKGFDRYEEIENRTKEHKKALKSFLREIVNDLNQMMNTLFLINSVSKVLLYIINI
jgi:hypothetical protein